jgi:hypothetical protein
VAATHAPSVTTLAMTPTPTTAPAPRLRRMRYEPEPGVDEEPPPLRIVPLPAPPATTSVDDDALRRSLGGIVRLALEVLDRRRPLAHIAAHFSESALRCWRVAAEQRRVRGPSRIGRLLVCVPRPGAAEVTAVCTIDGRVRALAARFDQAHAGAPWRCTAVRLG